MGSINATEGYVGQDVTISNTVLSLTDIFTEEEVSQSNKVIVFVNTNGIRAWWTGDTPTTTSGAVFTNRFEVYNANIPKLQLIRNSTTDAEVSIILER